MREQRLPSLDLLRGFAAASVILPHLLLFAHPQHSNILEATAVLGVEIFFVLSGFVLAPQILACFQQPSMLPTFLMRRWARTVPPFVLALCVVSLVTDNFGSNDSLRYLVYCQNIFAQHNTHDYFTVAWSLSVEEWFYIVFPACLIIAAPFVRRDRQSSLVIAIAFISVITIARTIFGDVAEWGPGVRRVVAFRIDSIAYGFVLYLLIGKPRPFVAVVAVVSFVPLASAALWGAAEGYLFAKFAFPFLAAGFGISVLSLALMFDAQLSRSRSLTWLSGYAGRISYSAYLFHSIFAAAMMNWLAPMRWSLRIMVVLAVTVAFCTVLYYAYERPFLTARPSYRRAPKIKIAKNDLRLDPS